jgi:hypothetical protein
MNCQNCGHEVLTKQDEADLRWGRIDGTTRRELRPYAIALAVIVVLVILWLGVK